MAAMASAGVLHSSDSISTTGMFLPPRMITSAAAARDARSALVDTGQVAGVEPVITSVPLSCGRFQIPAEVEHARSGSRRIAQGRGAAVHVHHLDLHARQRAAVEQFTGARRRHRELAEVTAPFSVILSREYLGAQRGAPALKARGWVRRRTGRCAAWAPCPDSAPLTHQVGQEGRGRHGER